MPFGVKTDVGSMYEQNKNTNYNIGPNSYPPMVALGKQTLSHKHNPVTYKFLNAPKFAKPAKSCSPTSKLKINLSSIGNQTTSSKRTEPLVRFSRGTRNQAQRITRCMTTKDSATPATKARLPHPNLNMEKDLIAFSGSMGAFS